MKKETVKLHSSAKSSENKLLGFRDVREEYEMFDCLIEGEIPEWLKGKVFKHCGGAYGGEKDFFDGLAHVVSFDIKKGKALFSNKYMRTGEFDKFLKTGDRNFGGAMTENKGPGFFENLAVYLKNNIFPSKKIKYKGPNPNVTFWLLENGHKFGAVTEGEGNVCAFDLETLATVDAENCLKPQHKKGFILTNASHFFREGESGGYHVAIEMVTHLRLGAPDFSFHYNIYKGDSAPFRCVYQEEVGRVNYMKREDATLVYEKRPSYMHSIAKSENYLVVICSSHKLDFKKILEQNFEKGFFGLFPKIDYPMEFIVLKENVERIEKVCKVSSNYVGHFWHVANVFEQGNDIVIEGSLVDKINGKSFLGRIRINLEKQEAVVKPIYGKDESEKEFEFQNINPYFFQKENDFIYGCTDFFKETSSLAKYNKNTKQIAEVFQEPRFIPSEPVVVPRADGTEDDAVILNVVLDTKKEESFLAVVDARSLDILAKIYAPLVCNYGLHTIYLPEKNLNKQIAKY
eukprot:snap_masked-scaffold_12-processed-gene-1.25-mRNA-1 protein AED:1.00 eAED:1.00 QI:0/-1/0/0/-1/1/1/0/515